MARSTSRPAIVGQPVSRYEGRLKVTGAAHYAADVAPAGLAHAVGVFSTVAAGRIEKLDTRRARQAPGVLAVLHHGKVPKLRRSPNDQSKATKVGEIRVPFEDETIFYAGQFVAAVVAETFEQARDAARQVRVTYHEGPAAVQLGTGQWPNARHPEEETPDETRGDPERAWEDAPVKLDCTYETPVEVHNAMELHSTVAEWIGGRLHLRESTQWVVGTQKALAAVLGIKPERISVVAEQVGGGFGSKLFLWPHTIVAAVAAQMTKRRVKLVLERKNEFTTTGHRPMTRQRLRVGAARDGRLVSMRHDVLCDTSLVDDYVEDSAETTKTLYRCEHVGTTHRMVPLHLGTPTSMRAPGAATGLFALESALDELAAHLGLDPVELRRRNEARKDPDSGRPWSSKRLTECFDAACKRFGWSRRQPALGSMREGGEILGWGMATASWPAFRKNAAARVELHRDGRAKVSCATQDIGTGSYTIIAQVAADVLGLPLDAIEVLIGRSEYPEGPISGGSMATASFVPAVMAAAQEAKDQLARARPTQLSVVAEAESAPAGEQKKYAFRSFGAHCVEVRWDPGLARLRVARVVTAIDVGRVMNPKTAENQVRGSVLMGLGMALLEASIYDVRDGRCVTDNLADYLVPVNADTPDVDVIFIDRPDPKIGGVGARGVGEIGITGFAAAVANAVYHATGKRVRRLPIRVEDLLETYPNIS